MNIFNFLPLQIPVADPALPDSVPTVRQELAMLSSLPFDDLMTRLINSAVTLVINVTLAIVVFYVGKFIINKLYRFVAGLFDRRKLDRSLTTFVLSMVRIVLYFILVVTVIGILGIETSSFIAIFASAGVAIGMALSGTLQNFAGGVLILLLKPYKIGDYIEAQGYAGTVREIQIFHTIINTADNKSIIIPNGGLSTGSLNNWSREDYRRVDWTVSISYGDNIDKARAAILEILASDDRVVKRFVEDDRARRAALQQADEHARKEQAGSVEEEVSEDEKPKGVFSWLKRRKHKVATAIKTGAQENLDAISRVCERVDRTPAVVVDQLGASSVDLKVRAWTATPDYWGLFYAINERIYKELPSAGISFPFPQMDVHIQN
ncbi:MAG: mechanosensitive ion channel [Muribaculaceae bacterium]|jgi:small conductance mechanosensitive channel